MDLDELEDTAVILSHRAKRLRPCSPLLHWSKKDTEKIDNQSQGQGVGGEGKKGMGEVGGVKGRQEEIDEELLGFLGDCFELC